MNSIYIYDKLLINLKREYWEYRKMLWGIPIIMSVLFVLAAIMAIVFSRFADEYQASESAPSEISVSAETEQAPDIQIDASDSDTAMVALKDDDGKDIEFNYVGIYMVVGWLAGFYYLLSSLYTDRRDKSVLYWKSLPVSETENVFSKLLFGAIGFNIAAIVLAWITALVLLIVVHGLASPEELIKMRQDSQFAFNATELFVWPLLGLVFGLLWGAPVFAYILMVSAMAKRLPLMLLVLPPLVLLILEGIFFRSRNLVGFFFDHTPAKALMMISRSPDIGSAFVTFFGEKGLSLLLGLAIAAAFLYTAVWYRNHRFEI